MSTRCQLEFYDGGDKPAARIYQHSDGYPDTKNGILARLKKLEHRLSGKDAALKKVPYPYDKTKTMWEMQRIYGPRLHDPEWAAAEYITMFRTTMGGNLYVSQDLHFDIAFLYRVVCQSDGLQVKVFTPGEVESVPTFKEYQVKTKLKTVAKFVPTRKFR